MRILDKKITISTIKLIVLIVLLIIVFIFYFFSNTDSAKEPKSFSILSGLLTGFIVGLFQLLLSWFEHRKIQKLEEMKIINVMADRDNRIFYESLIKKAKTEISVMGVTASRFVEHFADTKSDREDSRALLIAIARGVKVRLLLPNFKYLQDDDKRDAENKVKTAFEEIKKVNAVNFEFRYFDHEAAHSIFIIDDKCILGPVFPKVSSKDTPAIHTYCNSPFAKRYLDYFKKEWDNAN